METKQNSLRYVYVAVGIVVMLLAGFVYAWSLLAAPIGADFPEWTSAELSVTFTVCMTSFCLGGYAAGILSRKIPVRFNVCIAAILFAVGFWLTSMANSLMMLYVSYGVLCGVASGFVYNAVMVTMPRWFPKRPGLISGALLMSFGIGSMLVGTAFTTLTPDVAFGWRVSFRFMAALMGVVLLAASFFFKPAPAQAQQTKNAVDVPELSPMEMLRTVRFWMLFFWSVAAAGIGLVVISQAQPVAAGVGQEVSAATLSVVVGMISVFNGLGRLLFGAMFDKIGYKKTAFVVSGFAIASVAFLFAAISMNQFILIIPGFACIGVAYGGGPTIGTSCAALFFGPKYFSMNLPILNMNLMLASFITPLAAYLYENSGNFYSCLILLLVFALMGLGLMCAMPSKPGNGK